MPGIVHVLHPATQSHPPHCPVAGIGRAGGVPARAVEGVFDHEDWQLVCDNTRTCRAAGYQRDDADMPVSVLLTRQAGAGTAIEGRVTLGGGWQDSMLDALPARFRVSLWIDGKAHGERTTAKTALQADLTAAEVAALLEALTRDSRIEFRAGNVVWGLSDRGAAAALLKMDEFQNRIGTVGAAFRTGKQTEAYALPPLPAPIVKAAPLAPARPGDARFRKALRSVSDEETCGDLHNTGDEQQALDVVRLTKTTLLVSTRCCGWPPTTPAAVIGSSTTLRPIAPSWSPATPPISTTAL